MANLLQSAVAWMANTVGVGAPQRSPFDGRYWGDTAATSFSGELVNAETAAQLDVVQAVQERLAGTISTLPLMVFERDGAGGKRPAVDHPLYELLHDGPNVRQTSQEFFDDLARHLSFWRNSYCLITPGADRAIGALEPVHPSRMVKIERQLDGRVYYTFSRLAPQVGQDTYRDDEVWHIRKAPLTPDGLRGQYMWETSRETFGKALAVEKFGALYFRNGGSGGGVLEHPGSFKDKEQQESFLDAWRNGGNGLNRHKDRLLLYGVQYKPFSVNNDEAQFLETLKEVSVKLCRLWNMPPHMVGMLDRATFSNIEQQSVEFVMYTIAPWIEGIEQAAQRDLLLGDDRSRYFVEFNVAGLMRGDFQTRMQGYAWGRQWGWLSVNDIRALENLPSIGEAGDVYLQPMNMVPAGSEPEDSDSTAPGGPGLGAPANEPDAKPQDDPDAD